MTTPARQPAALTDLLAEFTALTPDVEASKRGTDHEGHEGWSISGDPQLPRCSCGQVMHWLVGAGEP